MSQNLCRRISVPFSCAQFEAKKLQGATANNSSYWIVYSETMSHTMPYENVSVFLEPKNPHQSESNMYPTCCIGGALGGGGGAEAYKLHLSKSQFRKSAQNPQYYAADKLFINWRTKNIKIPVKIQPSLWYRALYWNDHTILTSLTDIWIRAYSPRAGWQEALAQPKKYHLKPTGLLGNARNCCWPYSTSCVLLQVLHKPSHRPDINVSLHLIFSGWGLRYRHLCRRHCCLPFNILRTSRICKRIYDINFSWLSCECQNVRNRLVALGMICHPLAASLPANGSWSLILVRVCCSVSDPRLHCLHGPAVRKLFKCIASFHQRCNV